MSKANMSAESIALIASTEEPVTQELPQVFLELTIERTRDFNGNVISHSFTASTEHMGRSFEYSAGSKIAAHKKLVAQLNKLGIDPRWTAVRYNPADEPEAITAPASESEAQADEPEDVVLPADEPGEHESEFSLVVALPVLDKSGLLTPLSDPEAYKRVYLAAWKLATGFSAYHFSDVSSDAMDIRSSITAVMMNGDAGESIGIPAKAVGPWMLGTNGEQEMAYVRALKLPDPTTKPFHAGMGLAREAHLMTLSGRPVHEDKYEAARLRRERKTAGSYVGTRGLSTVGAKKVREDKRALAHAQGQAARTAAIKAGHGEAIAEIHYRWIYCATLRVVNEIHAEYERQLLDAGITEEQILSATEQMRGAA